MEIVVVNIHNQFRKNKLKNLSKKMLCVQIRTYYVEYVYFLNFSTIYTPGKSDQKKLLNIWNDIN
jgi:hypothetical protein